jgi:hypothetical protein
MSLADYPAFRTAPSRVQLARNRAWEEAWSRSVDQLPTPAELSPLIGDASEIAFEIFFGAAFFGVRWTGAPAEVRQCTQACFAAARNATSATGFLAALTARTDWEGWGGTIAFAEIGAVNAWRSTGAVRLDCLPRPDEPLDFLWRTLADSALARERAHPKAIEFACPAPVPHWFALPVSDAVPPFAVERALVQRALADARAHTS